MNLHMANHTGLIARATQIMERRRCTPDAITGGGAGRADVGMALQTHGTWLVAREHSRIDGPMGLMAGYTAVGPQRCMFINERAAHFAVTFVTAGFIGGGNRAHGCGYISAMRIVAVDARHGSFQKPMPVWPLESRPLRGMAGRAQLVYVIGPARHQFCRGLVHGMTRRAPDLILCMCALNSPGMRRLIKMTAQTDALARRRRERCGIADVFFVERFGVHTAWTVARLAGFTLPASIRTPLGVRFKGVMRVVGEGFGDVLVAYQTHVAADVGRLRGH